MTKQIAKNKKKDVSVGDLMDHAFERKEIHDFAGRKIWKKALGMVVTNVNRESEENSRGQFKHIIRIELDSFAELTITVENGQCKIETLPTNKSKMTLQDKVSYIVGKEMEKK